MTSPPQTRARFTCKQTRCRPTRCGPQRPAFITLYLQIVNKIYTARKRQPTPNAVFSYEISLFRPQPHPPAAVAAARRTSFKQGETRVKKSLASRCRPRQAADLAAIHSTLPPSSKRRCLTLRPLRRTSFRASIPMRMWRSTNCVVTLRSLNSVLTPSGIIG